MSIGHTDQKKKKMSIGHVIIVSEFTYEEWKRDYKDSMTKEEPILVQIRTYLVLCIF
jgi:hypothetical protein